jgi:serine/threonine protein kinase
MFVDYYNVLQVSPRAEKKVIEAAYKTLAMLHRDDDKKLKALNTAKEIVLDDHRRAVFDKERAPNTKIIGNYRLKSEIAEGGFGKTYLAEHVTLGTKVCIKHAHEVSPEDEEILLEEAKAIWDLRHYGIPNIRDVIRHTDGSLLLVMSYIPGPTLAQIMEKNGKGLDPEGVAWITERVLNILKYLHFHGVVHGDVKPQNIIIQEDTHSAVLVDYGLSLIRPNSSSSAKGHTPYFAPPEQIAGKTLIPESDFYSLGMTMLYALGGNIEHKRFPKEAPTPICEFVNNLLPLNPLSRPNWEKEDLWESFQQVRQKAFGRRQSGMKPLVTV